MISLTIFQQHIKKKGQMEKSASQSHLFRLEPRWKPWQSQHLPWKMEVAVPSAINVLLPSLSLTKYHPASIRHLSESIRSIIIFSTSLCVWILLPSFWMGHHQTLMQRTFYGESASLSIQNVQCFRVDIFGLTCFQTTTKPILTSPYCTYCLEVTSITTTESKCLIAAAYFWW